MMSSKKKSCFDGFNSKMIKKITSGTIEDYISQ